MAKIKGRIPVRVVATNGVVRSSSSFSLTGSSTELTERKKKGLKNVCTEKNHLALP